MTQHFTIKELLMMLETMDFKLPIKGHALCFELLGSKTFSLE